MKHFKIKDLINFYIKKKKISIIDCGCHKGGFLKKIGLKKIKNGILIDPLDYKVIKKFNLKGFKFLNNLVGSSNKTQTFKIYSSKYPEWSSVNSMNDDSIYKKKYSKYLYQKIIKHKIKQIKLDSLLKHNKKKFDILKIDCQSTTFEVLKGCEKNLKSQKFIMIVAAINLGKFYDKTDNFIKISKFLNKFGYYLINFSNAHSGELGKIDFDFKNYKIWTFDAIFLKITNEKI